LPHTRLLWVIQEGYIAPLPVAYHLDWLLFLYSFVLVNPEVTDEEVIQEGGKVPVCVLIFFPTVINGIASQCQKELMETLQLWTNKIHSIEDLNSEVITELEYLVESIINDTTKNYQKRKKKLMLLL